MLYSTSAVGASRRHYRGQDGRQAHALLHDQRGDIVRLLAACSLGGAGHLTPLVPFLHAADRRGDNVLVTGPPALTEMVDRTGFAFAPGGEPAEAAVAP